MKKAKVGVVQITSGPRVEANLKAVERTVHGAAGDGAELVVVPECFAYFGPDEGQREVAEPLPEGGPILERCRALARDAAVDVVLGGFWESAAEQGKVRNACVHVKSDGTVAAVYRKVHLFDVDLPDGTVLRESDHVAPGTETVVSQAPFGTLGLSVCYDLRFPELYRRLVDAGAIALAVPSAFTLTTGKEHWHVLLRARAIEQQCYVLAAAQTGHHWGTRVSYGHALIADPWGTVVAECSDGEGWAVAWLDPDRVARVRASLPSLTHRIL